MAGSPVRVNSEEIKVLELPASLYDQLQREARRSRKSIAGLMTMWIQDRQDAIAADRAERASQGKPSVKAEDLFRECGV